MIGGFDYAIAVVKKGAKIRREAWEPATYVILKTWANGEMLTGSFLYLQKPSGWKVPWIPTYEDLLADDWGAD